MTSPEPATHFGMAMLPKRTEDVVQRVGRDPVWTLSTQPDTSNAIQPAQLFEAVPMKAICEKESMPQEICCRTLKGEDERKLLNPDFVRDVILGVADGLTVPFGLTAGLSVLGNTKTVVVGGVAELLSGAISMGVGGFLSAKAERDHYRYLRAATRARVRRSCAGELEREVAEVLGPVGVNAALCRKVATDLMKVESRTTEQVPIHPESRSTGFFHKMLRSIARRPRMSGLSEEGVQQVESLDEIGFTPFLLKFGEGLEEISNGRLWASAITIGTCYALGGLIPLIPYFIAHSVRTALYWSIGFTSLTLLVFGVFKTYYTGGKIGFIGYTQGAISTLIIGAAAAGSAFGICAALESRT